MKISYMLKRENFYEINRKTLDLFFGEKSRKCKTLLYIYPELNAIVCKHPSLSVKKFLYAEFHVSGSPLRKVLVNLYTKFLLNSFGLFASKKIQVYSNLSADILIYPCNKKYRIFDFDAGNVTVIPKYSFPTLGLQNEIKFRKTHAADFIPPLLSNDDCSYVESIIDGIPAARSGNQFDKIKEKTYEIWSSYISHTIRLISPDEYANNLQIQFEHYKCLLLKMKKNINHKQLESLFIHLTSKISASFEKIPVGLSHGDLQPGNIWVENMTNKIYIIDWESSAERSIWYDEAALFYNIRMAEGWRKYLCGNDIKHIVVKAEEIIFRLFELINLPENYGTDEFNQFLAQFEERNFHVW